MLITKLPKSFDDRDIAAIVTRVSDRDYGGNAIIERCEPISRAQLRLKLRCEFALAGSAFPKGTLAPGARRAASGRALACCSWEVFRDVLTELFRVYPGCHVRTAIITYRGRADFLLKYPATAAKNIGSTAEPQHYAPAVVAEMQSE